MYSNPNLGQVRNLTDKIDSILGSSGLLFRVFGRSKSEESLARKIEKSPEKYSEEGKKVQDYIGIRVALYFADDIEIAIELLKDKFDILWPDSVIDSPKGDVFSARRCNLIIKLPQELDISYSQRYAHIVDFTFELQLRTVLSEGWHEVEHDLRYKARSEWEGHEDLGRALNGIYATLETSDWSMIKLFEELSHRHYRDGKVLEMLRTKFRVRLQSEVSDSIVKALSKNQGLLKSVFRAPRKEVVKALASVCRYIPHSSDILIYVINRKFIQNSDIRALESESESALLNNSFEE